MPVSFNKTKAAWIGLGALGGTVSTLAVIALLVPAMVDARPGDGMRGGDRGPMAMLKAADLNDDRRLSLDEYKTMTQGKFGEIDANGDGQLTQEESLEFMMARITARLEKRYERADQDGDGQISDMEFNEQSLIRFGRIDRNNDGFISRDDARGRGGWRGGRHGGDDKPTDATEPSVE